MPESIFDNYDMPPHRKTIRLNAIRDFTSGWHYSRSIRRQG